MPTEVSWPAEENWWTPGDVLAEEEGMSAMNVNASAPATMVLGNPEAGTSYPPGQHDQSLHGRDRMIPGTVVIDAGEVVTFDIKFGHRLAIYADGMKADDVLNNNPGPFVLYPVNRLYLQPLPQPVVKLRFLKPGKYLVVCAIKTHFYGANMWGWVVVR
ncbi:MAG TPA: hypothetical protein VLK84_13600 [Longimicrobium sp.]|nr:hypothetical protein [Longimicrobium sp.]